MSRILSLLLGLGCLTAAVGLGVGGWIRTPAAKQMAEPTAEQLTISPALHDFGAVGQGEVLAAEFTVTNHYRQPIHIVELVRSCLCAGLTADSRQLASGESTKIQLGWRTQGKRGLVSDTLGVGYQVAGGKLRHQQFRVRASVTPEVEADPERLVFGGRRPREQSLAIRLRDPSAAARVVSAHCSVEAVTANVAADGRTVALRYDPAAPVAAGLDHRLLLKLANAGQPWLEVPVTVEVVSAHKPE